MTKNSLRWKRHAKPQPQPKPKPEPKYIAKLKKMNKTWKSFDHKLSPLYQTKNALRPQTFPSVKIFENLSKFGKTR